MEFAYPSYLSYAGVSLIDKQHNHDSQLDDYLYRSVTRGHHSLLVLRVFMQVTILWMNFTTSVQNVGYDFTNSVKESNISERGRILYLELELRSAVKRQLHFSPTMLIFSGFPPFCLDHDDFRSSKSSNT